MGAAGNMSGGYQVQTDAIQQAITHLNNLLSDAQSNDLQLQQMGFMERPGDAPETKQFHSRVLADPDSSMKGLITDHGAFVTSVLDQISKLQKTLQRYQSGEDAARYGFGN